MQEKMENLTDVSVEELLEGLNSVDEKIPVSRLIAAICVHKGVTQSELAERFWVLRNTIFNWLPLLEVEDSEQVITDEYRA